MIWHTIEQAAERVGLQPRTIRGWVKREDLAVHRTDLLPGVVLIAEDELIECYRLKRARGGHVGGQAQT